MEVAKQCPCNAFKLLAMTADFASRNGGAGRDVVYGACQIV